MMRDISAANIAAALMALAGLLLGAEPTTEQGVLAF